LSEILIFLFLIMLDAHPTGPEYVARGMNGAAVHTDIAAYCPDRMISFSGCDVNEYRRRKRN
jgi:hypothetical protein